ncbi:MAG: YXWGXW repeat-containing protein [Burkholderiales bacterium]
MKTVLYSLTLAVAALVAPAISHAEISLSIGIAPPALPIYEQPPIPGDGYMWTPGYWAWDANDNDYYWVPGTWVLAPFVGALWTPGYWGWSDGGYVWRGGYWGSHVGYYGGINYGFGYSGSGYQGGHWNNGAFNYNRSVNNVGSARIGHVYNAGIHNTTINRSSYNGGKGGILSRPTRGDESIANMPHPGLTSQQNQHEQAARINPVQRVSVNHGLPRVAATPEPGAFNAPNVVPARTAQQQHAMQPHAAPRQGGPSRGERHER